MRPRLYTSGNTDRVAERQALVWEVVPCPRVTATRLVEVDGADAAGTEAAEATATEATETLAALADWNPELLRRAAIGETGDSNAGRDLLVEAVEVAEDESD